MSKRFSIVSVLGAVMVLVSACGGTPQKLDSKPAVVPSGVDLAGQWELRESDKTRRAPRIADEPPLVQSRTRRNTRVATRRNGSAAHVFLEQGKALKISQTAYSLFISYDRAVVEEYTFGENREVSVGPIEAQRVSGWEGDTFVVETLDTSGATLFESWRLADRDLLIRDIRIVDSREDITYEQRQEFDRR